MGIVEDTKAAIATLLVMGAKPARSAIARLVRPAVSQRTLQRRLEEAGTCVRDLTTEVRLELVEAAKAAGLRGSMAASAGGFACAHAYRRARARQRRKLDRSLVQARPGAYPEAVPSAGADREPTAWLCVYPKQSTDREF